MSPEDEKAFNEYMKAKIPEAQRTAFNRDIGLMRGAWEAGARHARSEQKKKNHES